MCVHLFIPQMKVYYKQALWSLLGMQQLDKFSTCAVRASCLFNNYYLSACYVSRTT